MCTLIQAHVDRVFLCVCVCAVVFASARQRLVLQQVRVEDEEGGLKVVYPSRADLMDDSYEVEREWSAVGMGDPREWTVASVRQGNGNTRRWPAACVTSKSNNPLTSEQASETGLHSSKEVEWTFGKCPCILNAADGVVKGDILLGWRQSEMLDETKVEMKLLQPGLDEEPIRHHLWYKVQIKQCQKPNYDDLLRTRQVFVLFCFYPRLLLSCL